MYIRSLLDTDLYKFNMMLFARNKMPDLVVEYAFKCRNDVDLHPFISEIEEEIKQYSTLQFTHEEVSYLVNVVDARFSFLYDFVGKPFLDFNNVKIEKSHNQEISIRIKDLWWKTILFEVPVLAIVNEVYSMSKGDEIYPIMSNATAILKNKVEIIKNNHKIKIMEFGTRRRFSREWQEIVLSTLLNEVPSNIIGTSNVLLAKQFGITPNGSFAHEFTMTHQGVYHPVTSQYHAFVAWNEFWVDKYQIALTDIFPTKKFLKDFTKDLAEKYTGFRHDSGDPAEWSNDMINMLEGYEIDPKTKTLVYSDGLDIQKCIELEAEFGHRINVIFGIGTNLTNDMGPKHKALQVVMKIVYVNNLPVAKLSNNIGKSMCEDHIYLKALVHLINKDIENA